MERRPVRRWADDRQLAVDEALALVPADLWPGKRKRNPGGIVLSAHSGGGDVLSQMMAGNRVPGATAGSRAVAGLLLFDAMHGWGPDAVAKFLKDRLDDELAHLLGIWTAKNATAAAEAIADEQTAWLQRSGFRFRGFASAKSYFKRYDEKFKPQLASWFTNHASELGGNARGRPGREGIEGLRRPSGQLRDRSRRNRAHADDGRRPGAKRRALATREHEKRPR